MGERCRWIYDNDVPGGKFLVPGCMNRANGGGEDVPGYANAQPVEALEKVARDNAAAAMWQIDRTMKAEAQVAALVDALGKAMEGLNWARAYLSTVGIKSTAVNEADAAVYAAIAAAKEGK